MKIRIRFDEHGKIRWLSHRDVARLWERVLRRAEIPVAYSEGFSPHPKLSFGLALSTGYESEGEYLDVDLRPDADVDLTQLPGLLTPLLPAGMTVQAAVPVEAGTDSLQQAVTSCSWRIELMNADDVGPTVDRALAATELPIEIERKGAKAVHDLRPAILDLRVGKASGENARPIRPLATIDTTLATQPRSFRPAELLRALDPTWVEGLVTRTHQWTLVDGARSEPIPLVERPRGATSTTHAGARAS